MIVGTPEQCFERLRPYADVGVGDFLLGALVPIDRQTIDLVAESVAPWDPRRAGQATSPSGWRSAVLA